MASVLSSVCIRFSAVFRALTPARGISEFCNNTTTSTRRMKHLFCVSMSSWTKPTLQVQPLSISSKHSQDSHGHDGLGMRTPSPLSPRFSVGNYLGINNITVVRNRHRRHDRESTRSVCLAAMQRSFSFSAQQLANKKELVTIHFINRDGEKMTVKAWTGQNLLDIVVDNDLDIDGYGACEGTLSCSTCHLIFSGDLFKILPKPSDEELDMLDLAYGQTDMSRLGCQVILTKEMDGMTVVVPEGVADARDA